MTTQTPATSEIEQWIQIRVQFFLKFWLGVKILWKQGPDPESPFHLGSSRSPCGLS